MKTIFITLIQSAATVALLWPLNCAAVSEVQELNQVLPVKETASGQWRLAPGHYQGNFRISSAMVLYCEPGAVLDGGGQGTVLSIDAPDVQVHGCELRGAGHDLTAMDAAIFIQHQANAAVVANNHIVGSGFGIWVDGSKDVQIHHNVIEGDDSLRSQDRGNGIHLYAVSGASVVGNRVSQTRDGIYIDTSNHNHLQNNQLTDLRYGIHYMFSNNNQVVGNLTRNTRTGYALMQSRQLTVTGNRSENDQNYGILMNYITYSTLSGNEVSRVRSGSTGDSMIQGAEGKALFIYNSVFNRIVANRFSDSALGIHLTAGSEDNEISANSFIGNRQQVKYVATRTQEWSKDGLGNYWSDYLGWDRNADGLGDVPYEPNDNIDRLVWMYPQMKLLMHSPAIELLRWVQAMFPVVKSPGVRDSFPLMAGYQQDEQNESR
ncbi:nitrous oxide reductase family maturation protein NosD [Bowmanella denitrificans]|uniref:nitrous oxide reductase family maturation protein NosD n=1 Tax=Bowmanella denitrificans TaxID=366582 RepID=UPI000C9B4DC4|nr:nitrous oxide reductase family maturation protein NosD [Bowmanella denitrificans]